MRTRTLQSRLMAGFLGAAVVFASLVAHPAAAQDDMPSTLDPPCRISLDHGRVAMTGVLGRGCIDGWGEYRIWGDPGSPAWDVSRDCSIAIDWDALLGKRVHVEGSVVLVSGGIAGILGEALAVGQVEIDTPIAVTTWGRVRSLYR